MFIGRQGQCALGQPGGLALVKLKLRKQLLDVCLDKIKRRHFHFVLVIHVAIGHHASRRIGPYQVIDRFHALQIHRNALEAIGNLSGHRKTLQTAGLLEVRELRNLHTV